MNRMIASSLAAFAVAVAGAAHATDTAVNDASTCSTLMKQFDQAAAAHDSAAKIVEARAKRSSAETACKAGNYKAGIGDLRAALEDIGVKPVVLPAS
jgi:hypothetical protein